MQKPVFHYDDYKIFVADTLKGLPRNGHGQMRLIAEKLRVHTTLISHIFRGSKNLTPEQACALCDFLKLPPLDTDYFLALVELQRAGTRDLRNVIQRRLRHLRDQSLELVKRLPQDRMLSEEEKATFYSSWHYSAVRLLTSIPQFRGVEEIANALKLSVGRIQRVIDFLLAKALIKQTDAGFELGPSRIHLGSDSTYIGQHHRNWRTKAMAHLDNLENDDLVFSAPVSLSAKDRKKIRAELVRLIEETGKTVEKSEPQELVTLNIDWIKII